MTSPDQTNDTHDKAVEAVVHAAYGKFLDMSDGNPDVWKAERKAIYTEAEKYVHVFRKLGWTAPSQSPIPAEGKIKEDHMLKNCKDELAARLRDETVIAITERDGQIVIEKWSVTSVWPSQQYPTKQKAAARVLQLLGIGPVSPQTWPEEIGIGSIGGERDEL